MNTPDSPALLHAAAVRDTETLQHLLAGGANANAVDAASGETALHRAARAGFTEGVRLLLAAGAAPNQRNREARETPLHLAAGALSASCARLLLEAGADVNALCRYGNTPLDHLNEDKAWYPGSELRELLLAHGARRGIDLSAPTLQTPPSAHEQLHGILETLVRFRTVEGREQEMAECLTCVESLMQSGGVTHIQRLGSGNKQQLIGALNVPALEDIDHGLMLCGHLDVVPGSDQQFRASWSGERLYARGAVDMKGSIACFLHALPRLAQSGLPIILAFTTDEESDMEGIAQVCAFLRERRIQPTLTLLGEPTGEQIGMASCGISGFHTDCYGRAAHSSRPQDGINALYLAAQLLQRMEKLDKAYRKAGVYVNAGQLQGGGDPSTVPDRATLHWGLRCYAPKMEAEFLAAWDACVQDVLHAYPGSRVETTPSKHLLSFRVEEEGELRLATDLAKLLGYPLEGIPYTTEAGYLQAAGQHVLILGAGHPREAHRANESVGASELAAYEEALLRICQLLAAPRREPPLKEKDANLACIS